MIDIANQVTQQNAHKTASCEPYIAAIVGPYNKKLTTCQSSMTWFYVQHEAGRIPSEDENPLQAGCTPMELQVMLLQTISAQCSAMRCNAEKAIRCSPSTTHQVRGAFVTVQFDADNCFVLQHAACVSEHPPGT